MHEESKKGKATRSRKGYKPEMKFTSRNVRRTTTFWVVEEKSTFKGKEDMPSYTYKPDPTSGKWNKVNFTDSSHKAIALCGGCKQLKPPIVVRHNTEKRGGVAP